MRARRSSRRRAPRPTFAPPPGIALLELLIACVVLAIGLLGAAGTALGLARASGDAWRTSLAATLASARMEQLRAAPCAAASGSATRLGVDERWSSALDGAGTLVIADSLRWPVGGGRARRTLALRSARPC